jgi:hypothetical protein
MIKDLLKDLISEIVEKKQQKFVKKPPKTPLKPSNEKARKITQIDATSINSGFSIGPASVGSKINLS